MRFLSEGVRRVLMALGHPWRVKCRLRRILRPREFLNTRVQLMKVTKGSEEYITIYTTWLVSGSHRVGATLSPVELLDHIETFQI